MKMNPILQLTKTGRVEMASFLQLLTVLLPSLLFCQVNGLAVMSVDIGSEWMKVAIVSPGVPMEIALNRESQRKTPVTVAFREGERLFGDPAVTIGVRFPEKAYSYTLELVGEKVDNPLVELFKKRFPYYSIEPSEERQTVVFHHPEGFSFTPEEIVAMILRQAQDIAQTAAGQPIKDAVITVPPYFNQAERRALLQAAQISGLNVLQLINGNTAVALNYGIFRRKDFNETPTNILFYDMGAGSTVATVVSYQLVKTKDTSETNPQLTVKGVGFDRTLGGLEMQLRLRDHFAKAFNSAKKTPTDVFTNSRSMAKLFKEAGRVKKVLSANTEHIAQVESLLDDKDFKCPITRAEFEDLCSDLFDRVIKPIETALLSANLNMDNIDQVILAGSGARVPKVQQKLLKYVQKPELGKSINTDESAALGAAYQAAHLSKGFKVKTFLIKDANLYPIQVDFQREYELEDKTTGVKNVRRILFTRNNVFPQKKVMTFNRSTKDFDFFINYGDLNFLSEFELKSLGSLNISKVHISGVDAAVAKHSVENSDNKGVKAHFKIDDSGILQIDQVESVFEKVVEEEVEESELESAFAKLGSTIGRLFSGSSSKTEEKSENAQDNGKASKAGTEDAKTDDKKNESSTEKGNKTKDGGAEKNATSKKEPKLVAVKEPLSTKIVQEDVTDLSNSQATEAIRKLKELDEHDHSKLEKEKSKNSLESFILETKEKLYMDEYERASTEEERSYIMNSLTEIGDWLEYESDEATTEVFKSKLSELKRMSRNLFERVKEHRERPEALKGLHEMLNLSRIFLFGARNMTEEEQIFTDVELKTLGKLITDTQEWKDESEKEQAALSLTSAPKLTTKLISEKIASLDREVKYLLNKARFATPLKKKKAPNETKSEGTNETEAEKESSTQENTDATTDIPKEEVTNGEVEVETESDSVETPETVVETPSPDAVKDEEAHSEL